MCQYNVSMHQYRTTYCRMLRWRQTVEWAKLTLDNVMWYKKDKSIVWYLTSPVHKSVMGQHKDSSYRTFVIQGNKWVVVSGHLWRLPSWTTATIDNCYRGQLAPLITATIDNSHHWQQPPLITATVDNCHHGQLLPLINATMDNCQHGQLPALITVTMDNAHHW